MTYEPTDTNADGRLNAAIDSESVSTEDINYNKPVVSFDVNGDGIGYNTLSAAFSEDPFREHVVYQDIDDSNIRWTPSTSLSTVPVVRGVGSRPTIYNPKTDNTPLFNPEKTTPSFGGRMEHLELDGADGAGPSVDFDFDSEGNKAHRWNFNDIRSRLPIIIFGSDELRIQDVVSIAQSSVGVTYNGVDYTAGAGLWSAFGTNTYIIGGDFGNNANFGSYGVRFSDSKGIHLFGNPDGKHQDKGSQAVAQWKFEGVDRLTAHGLRGKGPASDAPNDIEFAAGIKPNINKNTSLRFVNTQIGNRVLVNDTDGVMFSGGEGGGGWELDVQSGQDITVEKTTGPVSVVGPGSDNVNIKPGFQEFNGPHAGGSFEITNGDYVTAGVPGDGVVVQDADESGDLYRIRVNAGALEVEGPL